MASDYASGRNYPRDSYDGAMDVVDWSDGQWRNPPESEQVGPAGLEILTGDKTDMWRETSYGFIHDNGHALLAPLADGEAMECDVDARYTEQFDQAGMLVWSADTHWIKCGIENADGVAQKGAVVTAGTSDWSASPAPEWSTGTTTFRVSRLGDALTIRARRPGEPWQLVRLAPIDPARDWRAGPYAASPSRAGLRVLFVSWRRGPADSTLHE